MTSLLPPLNNIVYGYLGVIVVFVDGSREPLIGDWVNKDEYKKNLREILAFTNWNIPSSRAFYECENLEYILGINPTLGADMTEMFYGATKFNQPLNWDTSQVTYMTRMFQGAINFNQLLIWNTSQVWRMSEMFDGSGGRLLQI